MEPKKLTEIFKEELENSKTNFFIIDSGKNIKDVDFESYVWDQSINNKMATGDIFIYRKTKSIIGGNEFILTGVGKIGTIKIVINKEVEAIIEKPHPFIDPIFQHDLEKYKWKWKERGETWEHFWGQYGINQIPKQDFVNLLLMAGGEYNSEIDLESIKEDKEIAVEDFSVSDFKAFTLARPWQAAWSRRVKEAYGYKCAICGLSEAYFLIGSHIIPVGDKEYRHTRKDPANGICLCMIHDKAFDGGYLTITNDLLIEVSEIAQDDNVLFGYLSPFSGKTLKQPKRYLPKVEYLQYHQEKIFKKKN